ncbi:MAG: ribonuclease J [Bacilli bacterium]|nr:ribonuclease J [Bacilli bacterium]
MSDRVKIFALGGLDEEGKNCYVVDINNDVFVIECGVMDPDKTMPGVDYVIPQYQWLVENKSRIKGYFLTHGHDDVIGALAYIYPEAPAPIFGTNVSLAMLKMFTRHVKRDPEMYRLIEVKPSSRIRVSGREITFFQTAHNIPNSCGIAIHTDLGNIVFTSDFVIENSADKSFLNDMNALADLAEQRTLALLSESVYAGRSGYTSPLYRLTPHVEDSFKNAQGRIFIAMSNNDLYNTVEVIRLAVRYNKKVVCYDESVANTIATLQACGELAIPRDNFASLDDVLRLRDQDTLVLMTGFGTRVFRKAALLASGENEDKRFQIKPSDTFIIAAVATDNSEIEYKDAADELFRTGCKVVMVPKKTFLRMHASEEDLKMMASLLKPKYYIPVKGFYKDLLNNAMNALSMGIGLTHNNVFVIENGATVILDEKGGRIMEEGIPHGDLMIDGEGVGDVSATVLADRTKLAEGVVVLACTLSKSQAKITSNVEVQMKGFLYGREGEMLSRELIKVFSGCIEEFLQQHPYNSDEMKQNVYERCARLIRRMAGREPMVLPLIVELP